MNFKEFLQKDKLALIAEIKRASPSKGDINLNIDIKKQAKLYEESGANAISVLTEEKRFKGNIEFIKQVKQVVSIPILRKDFIETEAEIYRSKEFGADAILLISSNLEQNLLNKLINLTHELEMHCLVETHTKEDIYKTLKTQAEIIGINARNLKTLEVDLNNIINLAKYIPKDKLFIAESGINNKDDVAKLKKAGANGILVGTALMESDNVKQKICELKFAA